MLLTIPLSNKNIFPTEVLELFQAFHDRDKDLEQCSVISGRIDPDRLATVVGALKLGVKSRKALLASCEAINFPPQKLGL